MTTYQQNMAIFEMQRQGLHRFADAAEFCWDSGKTFFLDSSVSVPRMVRDLLDRCNRQVSEPGIKK